MNLIIESISILINIIFMFGFIWVIIWTFLLTAKNTRRFRYNKDFKKMILSLDKTLKGVGKYVIKTIKGIFNILIPLIISVILGAGSKSVIYQLNYALGEGYAHFASYAVGILIFHLIYPIFNKKESGE